MLSFYWCDRGRRIAVHFSPRQEQILTLAAAGLSDKEIAGHLNLSVCTIRTHLQRFYKDNDVHSRTRAVALWLTSNRTPLAGQFPIPGSPTQ